MKTNMKFFEARSIVAGAAFGLFLSPLLSCKTMAENRQYKNGKSNGVAFKGTHDDDHGKNPDDKDDGKGDGKDDHDQHHGDDQGKDSSNSGNNPHQGKGHDGGGTPSGICRYLDPKQTISEVIPGSPAGLPIPVSTYTKRPELLTRTGTDVSFNYTIFQRQDGSQKTLFWDSRSSGWYAVNWRATIKNSDSTACTISAVATSAPELRTMRGCFAPETKITMADGSLKRVEQISLNDHVANPLTGGYGIVVRVTRGPEKSKGLYEVGFGKSDYVAVTSKHPFMTRQGMRQADELKIGDEIAVKGGYRALTHVSRRPASDNQNVYNFAIATGKDGETAHMVEADGIVTGDLFLQERLETLRGLKDSVVELGNP
jgi:hypothetical protein